MSQTEAADRSRIARISARLAGPKARVEGFLKTFEWTWTNAVVFSLGFVFFLLITAVVLPSFWLYLAEQTLDWKGPTDLQALIDDPLGPELRLQIRDAIAMGLTTGPIITVLVVAAIMQNWRRKLRGQSGDVRPTGGYR